MKKVFAFTMMALLIFSVSCRKSEIEPQEQDLTLIKEDLKSVKVIPFIAGKTNNIGNVIIIDDEGGLFITAVISGWEFTSNHLYLDIVPPESHAPGQFPYTCTLISPTTLEFYISFDDLGVSCGDFYIALQADVTQGGKSEGAWAIPEAGAMHWYNKAGKQIGWGAYFNYPINCGPQISISPVTGTLNNISGRIKYRNLLLSGEGEEIKMWPNEGSYGLVTQDFSAGFDCFGNPYANGQYLFFPASNHIILSYNSPGLFTSYFQATRPFCQYVFPIPGASINAIQFMLKSDSPANEVILTNISINGVAVTGIYFGNSASPRWNITGDILDAGGNINFEADIMLMGQANGAESNLVEVCFGME